MRKSNAGGSPMKNNFIEDGSPSKSGSPSKRMSNTRKSINASQNYTSKSKRSSTILEDEEEYNSTREMGGSPNKHKRNNTTYGEPNSVSQQEYEPSSNAPSRNTEKNVERESSFVKKTTITR